MFKATSGVHKSRHQKRPVTVEDSALEEAWEWRWQSLDDGEDHIEGEYHYLETVIFEHCW